MPQKRRQSRTSTFASSDLTLYSSWLATQADRISTYYHLFWPHEIYSQKSSARMFPGSKIENSTAFEIEDTFNFSLNCIASKIPKISQSCQVRKLSLFGSTIFICARDSRLLRAKGGEKVSWAKLNLSLNWKTGNIFLHGPPQTDRKVKIRN